MVLEQVSFIESARLLLVGQIIIFFFYAMDKLKKSSIVLVIGCPKCLANEETNTHLLIHCSYATCVWGAILNRYGIFWVIPRSIAKLFNQWRFGCGTPHQKVLWNLSLFVGIWKLWLREIVGFSEAIVRIKVK